MYSWFSHLDRHGIWCAHSCLRLAQADWFLVMTPCSLFWSTPPHHHFCWQHKLSASKISKSIHEIGMKCSFCTFIFRTETALLISYDPCDLSFSEPSGKTFNFQSCDPKDLLTQSSNSLRDQHYLTLKSSKSVAVLYCCVPSTGVWPHGWITVN